MRNRGFEKHVLSLWFSQVKYSQRASIQGTRQTQANSAPIKLGEGIMKVVKDPYTEGAVEMVSEDEDFVASMEAVDKQIFSKGNSKNGYVC